MHHLTPARSTDGETDVGQLELLAEAVANVGAQARRYVREPADCAWHDLVTALARTHGDSPAYDLLRAVEIHARISGKR